MTARTAPARRHGIAVAIVAALALVGCGSQPAPLVLDSVAPASVPTTEVEPRIESFVAEPDVITPGQSSVLIVEVNDATTTVSIDQGIGPITNRSVVVSPVTTTTYTLTASDSVTSVTATVTVTVAAAAEPLATASAWTNVTGNLAGVESECGNMSFVSPRPDADVLIAGIAKNGVWANTDPAAPTWERLGTGPGSATITNRPSSFLYDPEHPGTWWMSGVYDGGGVYKTTDGGSTFEQLGDVSHVDFVSVDLTDPQRRTMLAGLHELTEVKKSTDGGATWSSLANLPAGIGFTTAPYVVDASTYLLGTYNADKSGIYRSTDAGDTWELVRDGSVAGPPFVAADGTIYWVVANDLVASTDKGATWATRAGRIITNGAIVELADGRLVAVLGDRLGLSSDGGVKWRQFGPNLPFPINGMTYSAQRNAFYVWHKDCDFSRPTNPIPDDAIMKLDVTEAVG